MQKTEKNKNLMVVHIASGDLWAGAEVQLFNLAKELNTKNNLNLHIILLNHGLLEEKLLAENICITVLDETKLNSLVISFRIIKLFYLLKPDIIHTHRLKENIMGGISSLFQWKSKSVRTVHGLQEFNIPRWKLHKYLVYKLDMLIGRYIQKRIIGVSDNMLNTLASLYTHKKINIIQNGLNYQDTIKSANEPVSFPDDAGSINIALVGRFVPVKRIDLFIDIARMLCDKYQEQYQFYIFGDGPLYKQYQAKIAEYNLDGNIHLMGFTSNILKYLKQMDLLLITSDHEGLPMNLLEAISLKVSIISHAVGAIPNVLDNGKCGTLIKSQDASEYFREIVNYTKNKDSFKLKADLAFERLTQLYDVGTTTQHYINIYNELCSN